MTSFIRGILVVSLCTTGACAAGSQGGSGRGNPNLLTEEQVHESSFNNVLDLIRNERPAWLRRRTGRSISGGEPIAVYVDGVRVGGPEVLQGINVSSVQRLERLDAMSATQRFGTGHTQGAILVVTRGGR